MTAKVRSQFAAVKKAAEGAMADLRERGLRRYDVFAIARSNPNPNHTPTELLLVLEHADADADPTGPTVVGGLDGDALEACVDLARHGGARFLVMISEPGRKAALAIGDGGVRVVRVPPEMDSGWLLVLPSPWDWTQETVDEINNVIFAADGLEALRSQSRPTPPPPAETYSSCRRESEEHSCHSIEVSIVDGRIPEVASSQTSGETLWEEEEGYDDRCYHFFRPEGGEGGEGDPPTITSCYWSMPELLR